MDHEFELILVGPDRDLCAAWTKCFVGFPRVTIVASKFQDLPAFDCMVSAANSFGLMDGGVDAAISRFFGDDLARDVRRRILAEYRGEQPVGTSMIVETGHPRHPFIAHTPTMRVPMTIARTDNVYRAMWGMLLAVDAHNRTASKPIRIVACPGLGTATGRVPYTEAARQMALAYRNFLFPPEDLHWGVADERQREIRYGGDFGLELVP